MERITVVINSTPEQEKEAVRNEIFRLHLSPEKVSKILFELSLHNYRAAITIVANNDQRIKTRIENLARKTYELDKLLGETDKDFDDEKTVVITKRIIRRKL